MTLVFCECCRLSKFGIGDWLRIGADKYDMSEKEVFLERELYCSPYVECNVVRLAGLLAMAAFTPRNNLVFA